MCSEFVLKILRWFDLGSVRKFVQKGSYYCSEASWSRDVWIQKINIADNVNAVYAFHLININVWCTLQFRVQYTELNPILWIGFRRSSGG